MQKPPPAPRDTVQTGAFQLKNKKRYGAGGSIIEVQWGQRVALMEISLWQ